MDYDKVIIFTLIKMYSIMLTTHIVGEKYSFSNEILKNIKVITLNILNIIIVAKYTLIN